MDESPRELYRRVALEKTEKIFVALDKAGLIFLPPHLWGWGDMSQEIRRVILDAGFGITDIIAPVKYRRQASTSLAPHKRKGEK